MVVHRPPVRAAFRLRHVGDALELARAGKLVGVLRLIAEPETELVEPEPVAAREQDGERQGGSGPDDKVTHAV